MKPKEETAAPPVHPSPVASAQQPPVQAPVNPLLNPRPTGPAQPRPQAPPQEPLDPNNEIVQGLQHKQETIQELMSMGFDRAEVEQALVCAYYNKERAVDYLLNVS